MREPAVVGFPGGRLGAFLGLLFYSAWAFAAEPKKVIFETDMCLDVDDVGALAMLHALADRGEAELLAVSFNEVHKSGAAAIDAINTYYGRGDIPIGLYRKPLAAPDTSRYLDFLANFSHDLVAKPPEASVDVYRRVLAAQPDRSVTIISVGFLNNLYDLLQSDADLIRSKVAELVVMGGVKNDGFNLVRHGLVSQSESVLRDWPGPVVISQFGHRTLTGRRLSTSAEDNPVREAYYRWFEQSYKGRSSWDQVAVLYGVRGTGPYFERVTVGSGELRNGFVWQMQPGLRSYLKDTMPNEQFETLIESLMLQTPKRLSAP